MKHVGRPPALALWLLDWVGTDAALTGDLVEEYARGRSRTWFWKQVLSVLVRSAFPGYVPALRWLAALPVAILAAAFVPRLAFFLFRADTLSGLGPVIYATLFFMPAIFVGTGVWIVPSRKDSAARIGLAVVTAFGALIVALAVPAFSGQPFHTTPIIGGICIWLGGIAGYLCCRGRSAAEADRAVTRRHSLDGSAPL